MAKITPIDILKVVSSKYTLVTGLLCAKHTFLAKQAYFFEEKLAPKILAAQNLASISHVLFCAKHTSLAQRAYLFEENLRPKQTPP